MKYHCSSLSDESSLVRLLREMQAYLRECEKKKNMLSLINCIQIILLKFANRILLSSGGTLKNSKQCETLGNMGKKLREELVRLKQSEKNGSSKGLLLGGQEKQRSDIDDLLLVEKRQRYMSANKVFTDIQQKFDNFKGLDLDFSYFRGSYFQAKEHYETFYQNYCQRNGFVINMITSFSDRFQNFIQKKQSMTKRKERANRIKQEENGPLRIEDDCINQENSEEVNGFTLVLPFNLHSSKASGKLKNVYINLGKSYAKQSKNDLSSCMLNKSQGSTSKKQRQKSNRIDLFMLNRGHASTKNRMRTDPGKIQRSQTFIFAENQTKTLNDDKSIRYVSPKVSIRTKYFELTSIPPAPTQQPKSKTFSNNKFAIRLTDRNKPLNLNSKK